MPQGFDFLPQSVNFFLKGPGISAVSHVDLRRDEPKIAGFISSVVVNPVELKRRVIPPRKSEQVSQESFPIFAPLRPNRDAAPPIIFPTVRLRVVAPPYNPGYATEQPLSMFIVRAHGGIAPPLFMALLGLAPDAFAA